MRKEQIGFLHPGAMGVSLAATAQNTGYTTCWVLAGRSRETYERATANDLVELQTIQQLCDQCAVIISVCPPYAATEVAKQVLACSYKGIFADVNAISPHRAEHIGQLMSAAGVEFVDGGIIGGPAWKPGKTWLYLSGPKADQVAAYFAAGPLETEVISDEIGKASALKMVFAANTKGTTALLCAVVAAAEEMGVRKELEQQWSRYDPEFAQQTLERVRAVTAKAWRFSGEMEEIASTFEAAGLPGGFHLAAHDIYQRLAGFKGADPVPSVEAVLAALLHPEEG